MIYRKSLEHSRFNTFLPWRSPATQDLACTLQVATPSSIMVSKCRVSPKSKWRARLPGGKLVQRRSTSWPHRATDPRPHRAPGPGPAWTAACSLSLSLTVRGHVKLVVKVVTNVTIPLGPKWVICCLFYPKCNDRAPPHHAPSHISK